MSDSLTLQDLCFVGLNGHVAALDRYSGAIIWEWRTPRSRTNFVTLLLDGDQLLVSTNGFLYGLDALRGRLLWNNELCGYGVGIASFASCHGSSANHGAAARLAEIDRRRRRAAAS